jgi:hypothetical protein
MSTTDRDAARAGCRAYRGELLFLPHPAAPAGRVEVIRGTNLVFAIHGIRPLTEAHLRPQLAATTSERARHKRVSLEGWFVRRCCRALLAAPQPA